MCLYCVYHSRDTTPTISIRASSTDNTLREKDVATESVLRHNATTLHRINAIQYAVYHALCINCRKFSEDK